MAVYVQIICMRCGITATRATTAPHMCIPCAGAHAHESASACSKVGAAVKRGQIPPASSLLCVDCGAQARDYDHRDYTKPLEVEPTCRSCNHKRGPALDSKLRHIQQAA